MSDKPLYSEAEIEAALAVCDSEPVHIPGVSPIIDQECH